MLEFVIFTFVTEAALLSAVTAIVVGALIKYEVENRE